MITPVFYNNAVHKPDSKTIPYLYSDAFYIWNPMESDGILVYYMIEMESLHEGPELLW